MQVFIEEVQDSPSRDWRRRHRVRQPGPRSARLLVLIAEDHEDTREMHSTYLTSQGLRVVVAEDVMPTS